MSELVWHGCIDYLMDNMYMRFRRRELISDPEFSKLLDSMPEAVHPIFTDLREREQLCRPRFIGAFVALAESSPAPVLLNPAEDAEFLANVCRASKLIRKARE